MSSDIFLDHRINELKRVVDEHEKRIKDLSQEIDTLLSALLRIFEAAAVMLPPKALSVKDMN